MGLKQLFVSMLPTPIVAELRRVRLRARLEVERHGRLQRRINASIVVDGLTRKPRLKGSVWGVCLAKNEEDIIGQTVRHMLEHGVAGLIVVDNGSTDGTRSVLDGIAAADPRVHVGTDAETGFHQGSKTSCLGQQYSRKVQNGVAALEAAGMDESIATHWRLWASLTEAEQAERWSAYLADEDGDLKDAFVRADRLVIGDPTLWRMWDPDRLFADDN